MRNSSFVATTIERGFTLIELLVVIAIAAILAAMAAPSLMTFVHKSAMRSLSSDFVTGIQKARLEAVNRNMCTTICRSTTTGDAAPRCSITASGDYTSSQWHSGWLIYLNPTCDREVTADDPANAGNIILIRQPGNIRYGLDSDGATTSITFGPTGISGLGPIETFNLVDAEDSNNTMNRAICIDTLGRARVLQSGASCS